MPANSKYLTTSGWQRLVKILAGFVGGFLVSISLHIALATWINRPYVIMTSSFTAFLLWAGLMILAFLAKNPWKIWAIYILTTVFFSLLAYYG